MSYNKPAQGLQLQEIYIPQQKLKWHHNRVLAPDRRMQLQSQLLSRCQERKQQLKLIRLPRNFHMLSLSTYYSYLTLNSESQCLPRHHKYSIYYSCIPSPGYVRCMYHYNRSQLIVNRLRLISRKRFTQQKYPFSFGNSFNVMAQSP